MLLVDAEVEMRLVLGAMLRGESYQVVEAATATDGLLKLVSVGPRIVIAGLELPDMDGIALTRRIREQSVAPVIVISRRDDEDSQVSALDSGASDFITTPVREATFLARARAALRHGDSPRLDSGAVVVGCLRFDPGQSRVWVRGVEVRLTRTELRLLGVFMQDAGSVLTHRHLLRRVWGATEAREIQYLRVYVKQLREKIERDPAHPELLLTSPGVGYRLSITG